VHETIATANSLQQEPLSAVVEQEIIAQRGVAIPVKDEAQGKVFA